MMDDVSSDLTAMHSPLAPDFRVLFESAPGLYLVLRPDAPRYSIVAVSDTALP